VFAVKKGKSEGANEGGEEEEEEEERAV